MRLGMLIIVLTLRLLCTSYFRVHELFQQKVFNQYVYSIDRVAVCVCVCVCVCV